MLASAVGPLLLAWWVEWTGSYTMMFRVLAGVIALVGCMALFTSSHDRVDEGGNRRQQL